MGLDNDVLGAGAARVLHESLRAQPLIGRERNAAIGRPCRDVLKLGCGRQPRKCAAREIDDPEIGCPANRVALLNGQHRAIGRHRRVVIDTWFADRAERRKEPIASRPGLNRKPRVGE